MGILSVLYGITINLNVLGGTYIKVPPRLRQTHEESSNKNSVLG